METEKNNISIELSKINDKLNRQQALEEEDLKIIFLEILRGEDLNEKK